MTITAKYSSICPACGHGIIPGTQVEWSKGTKARHTSCPVGSVAIPKAQRSIRSRKGTPPAGPELRNDRDPYRVGDVLVVQLTAAEVTECEARQGLLATDIPSDKPVKRAGDRRVAVVVIHADRISQEWADDNGFCGRFGATVRLATAQEASPLVVRRMAKLTDAAWSRFTLAWSAIANAAIGLEVR